MKNLFKILLAAFILRLVISFLGEHGDVVNYYWWTKDLVSHGLLGFYDRNIANAMRPTYPPVTSYLFLFAGYLHEVVLKIFWVLNVNIRFFPSNLIFWMESDHGWYIFNKLPAIFADLGIVYLLYIFVRDLKNEKAGLIASSIFAFTPVFWYNSSLWGQTDSIFALPMLAAFYFLHKGRVKTSIFMYGLAILSKPTALFALPIFIFWLLKKSRFSDLLLGFSIFILQVLILYFPFHPNNLIMWVILFYRRSLSGELGYMVANAFNFWALIFGFDNRPDTSLFLGIPANLLGNTVYAVFVLFSFVMLLKRNLKTTSILLMTSILLFSAFMFLPRMHDRYFYPVLIMLIPTAAIDKKIRNIFWFVSTIHLINLYHFWWIPKINILINVLSNKLFENILIMSNIIIFIYLIYTFKKDHAKAN